MDIKSIHETIIKVCPETMVDIVLRNVYYHKWNIVARGRL